MIYTSKWAYLDPTGTYRWILGRTWYRGPTMHFIMLNPSTADGQDDDATIKKCVGFAVRAGCGTVVVTNLFSYRATKPRELITTTKDIVGVDTDRHIVAMSEHALYNVAAWGVNVRKPKLRDRPAQVVEMLKGKKLLTLKTAPDGIPWHPLMLPYESQLTPLET